MIRIIKEEKYNKQDMDEFIETYRGYKIFKRNEPGNRYLFFVDKEGNKTNTNALSKIGAEYEIDAVLDKNESKKSIKEDVDTERWEEGRFPRLLTKSEAEDIHQIIDIIDAKQYNDNNKRFLYDSLKKRLHNLDDIRTEIVSFDKYWVNRRETILKEIRGLENDITEAIINLNS